MNARTVHRLRVSLVGSDPEIWRSFDIDASLSLADLHDALQLLMGWRLSHLHQFFDSDPFEQRPGRFPRHWVGIESIEDDLDGEPDEGTTIRDAFGDGGPLYYEYDFGDGWMHRLDLIGSAAAPPHQPPVLLLDGQRRAPYENSGGLPGYDEKLGVLADSTHPDHDWVTGWVRETVGPWSPADPEFFDADGVQGELNLRFSPETAGVSVMDMSGLVPAELAPDGLTELSPIVSLLAALPVPIRIELRLHLHRTGALSAETPPPDVVAPMLAPFRWLIATVGADGLPLTKAGWMPPATVLDGMTTLGWREGWIGEANREDLTWPIRELRDAAQRMGIVRVRKGMLLLGAEAKKALTDPGRLWRLVTSRALRGLSDAEADAGTLLLLALADGTATTRNEEAAAVGFGLAMLGWGTRDGEPLPPAAIQELTRPVTRLLADLGVQRDSGRTRSVTDAGRMFARAALR